MRQAGSSIIISGRIEDMEKILLFIFILVTMHFKMFLSKKEKHSKGEIFRYFLKVAIFLMVFIVLPFSFIYNSIIFDIEDEYESYFETPIELVSELEGFGMGFLDGYTQFAFKAESGAVLKDNDKYQTITDSVTKIKTIKDFQRKFNSDTYKKFEDYLKDLSYDNTELKFHYRDSSYVDREYLYMKNGNIHFFTVMY